jgi:MATE family multidrug resistance protein
MTHEQLSYGAHARGLFRLGVPLIGSFVAGFAIHMTDTIMLGWYSVTSLAASTIAGSLWFILFILGAGFGQVVMPLVAEAGASGDDVRVRRVTRMAMWLSLIYFAIVIPVFFWSETVLLAVGQTAEVAALGQQYLRIAGFGMAPGLLIVVFRSYLSGQHLTAVQLWVTLLGVVLNAFINYALIFGNWGAPELGIQGAAIASVSVQMFTMLFLAGYAQIKLPHFHLFQRIWKSDWPIFWHVFRLGVPIGVTSLAESGLFVASSAMMGWIGEIELAAHGIALQLVSLMFMFHIGMSQAATIRAGAAFGKRNINDLRRGARMAYVISASFGLLCVVLFLAFPSPLISLFIDPTEPARDELITIGTSLLIVAALFQMADLTQIVSLSLLRGIQDMTVPMWIAAFSYWVLAIPFSYVMAFTFGFGPEGLWLGLTLGLAVAGLLLTWRFWSEARRLA